jgi:hypothetical protein
MSLDFMVAISAGMVEMTQKVVAVALVEPTLSQATFIQLTALTLPA